MPSRFHRVTLPSSPLPGRPSSLHSPGPALADPPRVGGATTPAMGDPGPPRPHEPAQPPWPTHAGPGASPRADWARDPGHPPTQPSAYSPPHSDFRPSYQPPWLTENRTPFHPRSPSPLGQRPRGPPPDERPGSGYRAPTAFGHSRWSVPPPRPYPPSPVPAPVPAPVPPPVVPEAYPPVPPPVVPEAYPPVPPPVVPEAYPPRHYRPRTHRTRWDSPSSLSEPEVTQQDFNGFHSRMNVPDPPPGPVYSARRLEGGTRMIPKMPQALLGLKKSELEYLWCVSDGVRDVLKSEQWLEKMTNKEYPRFCMFENKFCTYFNDEKKLHSHWKKNPSHNIDLRTLLERGKAVRERLQPKRSSSKASNRGSNRRPPSPDHSRRSRRSPSTSSRSSRHSRHSRSRSRSLSSSPRRDRRSPPLGKRRDSSGSRSPPPRSSPDGVNSTPNASDRISPLTSTLCRHCEAVFDSPKELSDHVRQRANDKFVCPKESTNSQQSCFRCNVSMTPKELSEHKSDLKRFCNKFRSGPRTPPPLSPSLSVSCGPFSPPPATSALQEPSVSSSRIRESPGSQASGSPPPSNVGSGPTGSVSNPVSAHLPVPYDRSIPPYPQPPPPVPPVPKPGHFPAPQVEPIPGGNICLLSQFQTPPPGYPPGPMMNLYRPSFPPHIPMTDPGYPPPSAPGLGQIHGHAPTSPLNTPPPAQILCTPPPAPLVSGPPPSQFVNGPPPTPPMDRPPPVQLFNPPPRSPPLDELPPRPVPRPPMFPIVAHDPTRVNKRPWDTPIPNTCHPPPPFQNASPTAPTSDTIANLKSMAKKFKNSDSIPPPSSQILSRDPRKPPTPLVPPPQTGIPFNPLRDQDPKPFPDHILEPSNLAQLSMAMPRPDIGPLGSDISNDLDRQLQRYTKRRSLDALAHPDLDQGSKARDPRLAKRPSLEGHESSTSLSPTNIPLMTVQKPETKLPSPNELFPDQLVQDPPLVSKNENKYKVGKLKRLSPPKTPGEATSAVIPAASALIPHRKPNPTIGNAGSIKGSTPRSSSALAAPRKVLDITKLLAPEPVHVKVPESPKPSTSGVSFETALALSDQPKSRSKKSSKRDVKGDKFPQSSDVPTIKPLGAPVNKRIIRKVSQPTEVAVQPPESPSKYHAPTKPTEVVQDKTSKAGNPRLHSVKAKSSEPKENVKKVLKPFREGIRETDIEEKPLHDITLETPSVEANETNLYGPPPIPTRPTGATTKKVPKEDPPHSTRKNPSIEIPSDSENRGPIQILTNPPELHATCESKPQEDPDPLPGKPQALVGPPKSIESPEQIPETPEAPSAQVALGSSQDVSKKLPRERKDTKTKSKNQSPVQAEGNASPIWLEGVPKSLTEAGDEPVPIQEAQMDADLAPEWGETPEHSVEQVSHDTSSSDSHQDSAVVSAPPSDHAHSGPMEAESATNSLSASSPSNPRTETLLSLQEALGGDPDMSEDEPDRGGPSLVMYKNEGASIDYCPRCNTKFDPVRGRYSLNCITFEISIKCLKCDHYVTIRDALGDLERSVICG